MKYLRRELNQVEKEYLKQFGQDSLNRVILHDPDYLSSYITCTATLLYGLFNGDMNEVKRTYTCCDRIGC